MDGSTGVVGSLKTSWELTNSKTLFTIAALYNLLGILFHNNQSTFFFYRTCLLSLLISIALSCIAGFENKSLSISPHTHLFQKSGELAEVSTNGLQPNYKHF